MTDRNNIIGQGAFEPDPPRDVQLGNFLREQVGSVPMHAVDWEELATAISERVAQHAASPWWAYAARWERRMVPVALAAGIAGLFALLTIEALPATTPTFVSAASVNTAIMTGASFEEAAFQFAHSVTIAGDITAGTPE